MVSSGVYSYERTSKLIFVPTVPTEVFSVFRDDFSSGNLQSAWKLRDQEKENDVNA